MVMTRRRRVMKFVLGLVALVLVGLLLYVYTSKENKQPQKQTVHKTVKEVTPSQEEVASVEKKVSKKTKPAVQHTVKKASLKVEKTSNSDGEIGKGLTLEGIKNANVSDEEKERMKMDIVYNESIHTEATTPSTSKEIEDMITKDLETGLNK